DIDRRTPSILPHPAPTRPKRPIRPLRPQASCAWDFRPRFPPRCRPARGGAAMSFRRPATALAAAAAAVSLGLAACADADGDSDGGIDSLEIIVPAAPGGGWDQTGRTMQAELQDNDLVSDAQVVNVGGAGGTVGLAQLATSTNPDTLMVMGYVMVGAIETNQSQTTLEDVTPIARLTEEPRVGVAPAESP